MHILRVPDLSDRIVSPKRASRLLFWCVLIVASLVGCAGRNRATPESRFTFAYVQDACGPTDGPALELFLTDKQAECGKFEPPLIRVWIEDDLPKSVPHDYSIASSKYFFASRCLKQDQCPAAVSGVLHLTKYAQGKAASGDYEFHFQDGSFEKGSFDASWCVTRLLCG